MPPGVNRRSRAIINSVPRPNTAQIRASLVEPLEYSQEDLKTARPVDLQAVKAEFEKNFRLASISGPIKVQQVGTVRVERMSGKFALVIP